MEALFGRRSALRASGEIPDSPLAYRSVHEPVPLSELERMLVLGAMGWTTDGTSRSPGTPGARRTSRGARSDPAFKACVARQAQYVFDTFDQFPGTVPSVFIMNYVRLITWTPARPVLQTRRIPARAPSTCNATAGPEERMTDGRARTRGTLTCGSSAGNRSDVLIAGGRDPAEAWQLRLDGLADRYRLTAYDNRGMGRTPLPAEPFSVATMADDAVASRALDVPTSTWWLFGGSVIAQNSLRHPGLVRSLVLVSNCLALTRTSRRSEIRRWLPEAAPNGRLPGRSTCGSTPPAPRRRQRGKIVEEVLAFPHQPSAEAIQHSIDAFWPATPSVGCRRSPADAQSRRPDAITPALRSRVADAIPGARFEILAEEAHQPSRGPRPIQRQG